MKATAVSSTKPSMNGLQIASYVTLVPARGSARRLGGHRILLVSFHCDFSGRRQIFDVVSPLRHASMRCNQSRLLIEAAWRRHALAQNAHEDWVSYLAVLR
jgi:hypothetical protein